MRIRPGSEPSRHTHPAVHRDAGIWPRSHRDLPVRPRPAIERSPDVIERGARAMRRDATRSHRAPSERSADFRSGSLPVPGDRSRWRCRDDHRRHPWRESTSAGFAAPRSRPPEPDTPERCYRGTMSESERLPAPPEQRPSDREHLLDDSAGDSPSPSGVAFVRRSYPRIDPVLRSVALNPRATVRAMPGRRDSL